MTTNKTDKTLRVSEKTHKNLEELKYKTKTSIRTLAEEAVDDLKVKKLRKRGRNAKSYIDDVVVGNKR